MVPELYPNEQKKYLESKGVNVKKEMGEFFGHMFKDEVVAGEIGKQCYLNIPALGITEIKPYDNTDKSYLTKGYLRKWDQWAFATEMSLDVTELKLVKLTPPSPLDSRSGIK